MSQKRKNHPAKKKNHPQQASRPTRGRGRQKWTTWAVVFLMLAAMLMYVLSDDESVPPQDLSTKTDSMKSPQKAMSAD